MTNAATLLTQQNNPKLKRRIFSKLFNTTMIIALLLSALTWQCKKVDSTGGTTDTCPTIISTDPANGALNVVTNKKISATFNKEMNPATINSATFFVTSGANQILGTVTYTGNTATFTPANLLDANTVYTCTITTGAKDVAKSSMIANYVWSFNTGSTPIIVSTDPVNGAADVPFNKAITATFSTIMNPATINNNTFILKQGTTVVPGVVTYSGFVATFTPTNPLLANSVYNALITADVKDLIGNAMAANYTWSFSTGAAPLVVSTDPTNNANNVIVNKNITANFNKVMDAATINATNFTLKNGATTIVGVVTYNGVTATFNPSNPLAINTLYTATIATGVKDVSGNNLAANYVWSFTTGNSPVVISTDPANNASNVPLNKIITASFSTTMDATSINNTTFLLKEGTNNITGVVSYAGTTASFTPTSPLIIDAIYTATITTGAKDLLGNTIANNYVWTFSTTGNAPRVISTDPMNGATNVFLSKTVSATFSTAMNPATINAASFTIKDGNNPVLGTVSYAGTTATFNPTNNFSTNTTYTATITTNAKDLAGNSLVNNYVWSFRTSMSAIAPPALGTAGNFGAFGGNAGTTNQGLNTVINNGGIGTTAASTLVTGFHDGLTNDVYTETPLNKGLVSGGIFTAPPAPGTATSFAIATQALIDANAAYNSISPASMPGGTDPGAGELGGLVLAPGVYKSASGTFKINSANLTLDAKGDPNAVWVFQTASGLTVGTAGPGGARSVIMINGASPKNVFWYVGSAATINSAGGGVMVGTIIAKAGVTFSTSGNAVQTVLNGRAISLVASVTMVNTTINVQ